MIKIEEIKWDLVKKVVDEVGEFGFSGERDMEGLEKDSTICCKYSYGITKEGELYALKIDCKAPFPASGKMLFSNEIFDKPEELLKMLLPLRYCLVTKVYYRDPLANRDVTIENKHDHNYRRYHPTSKRFNLPKNKVFDIDVGWYDRSQVFLINDFLERAIKAGLKNYGEGMWKTECELFQELALGVARVLTLKGPYGIVFSEYPALLRSTCKVLKFVKEGNKYFAIITTDTGGAKEDKLRIIPTEEEDILFYLLSVKDSVFKEGYTNMKILGSSKYSLRSYRVEHAVEKLNNCIAEIEKDCESSTMNLQRKDPRNENEEDRKKISLVIGKEVNETTLKVDGKSELNIKVER